MPSATVPSARIPIKIFCIADLSLTEHCCLHYLLKEISPKVTKDYYARSERLCRESLGEIASEPAQCPASACSDESTFRTTPDGGHRGTSSIRQILNSWTRWRSPL